MSIGKLIIFSAPSGAGKTTIVKEMLKFEDLRLKFSISACSRAKRENEVHGRDYFFLTTDEFKQKIAENLFIEWEEVYSGSFYGTLKTEVDKLRNDGFNVVFDVDVAGGINIKKQYGTQALSIFIEPPSREVLERRLRNRCTDSEESILKRLAKVDFEMTFANEFDKIIVNDDLQNTLEVVKKEIINFLKK